MSFNYLLIMILLKKIIEYMVMIYPSKGLFSGLISSSSGYRKPEVDHENGKYAKKIIYLPKITTYTYTTI